MDTAQISLVLSIVTLIVAAITPLILARVRLMDAQTVTELKKSADAAVVATTEIKKAQADAAVVIDKIHVDGNSKMQELMETAKRTAEKIERMNLEITRLSAENAKLAQQKVGDDMAAAVAKSGVQRATGPTGPLPVEITNPNPVPEVVKK